MEGDSRNPKVSLLKKYDIPLEHLSYEYIGECSNKKELERIIRILRSGEEGSYPDLLKTAEEKLRKIAPDSRALRVETPILTKESLTSEEWSTVENELLSWEKEMKVMDKSLDFEKSRLEIIGNKNLPAVRVVAQPKSKIDSKKTKAQTNSKNERIKSGDYKAWDKFDVDRELLKMDVEEERQKEEAEKKKREAKKQTKEKKLEVENVDKDSYSMMEQQVLANQAKDRGNECYKSGDLENALKYYDISIRFYATANAYNNRAMTYLKLKEYEKAVSDCNKVLVIEKNNVKALHRRATAYQNMPGNKDNSNYYDELAWQDLSKIILLEPNNKVAQADLQKLKKKLNIEDVGKKYRMAIYEGGEDSGMVSKQIEKCSSWNIRDDSTSIENLPLTYYGPSTSTFQCKPYSMVHHALSGSTIPGQIMCKCNSNRPRQNPLCQKCGEAMCTPKPSKKAITYKTKAEVKSNAKKDNDAKNQLLKEESKKPEKIEISDNKPLNDSPKKESKTNEVDTIKGAGGDLAPANETDKKTRNEEVEEKIELTEKGDQVQSQTSSNLTARGNECGVAKDSGSSVVNNIVEEKSKLDNNLDLDKSSLTLSQTGPSNKDEKTEEAKATFSSEPAPKNKNSAFHQTKTSNHENTYKFNSNNNISSENKIGETSSSQSEVNLNSRKSKNKKKKSKEHKETKLRKHAEPVKIVHAAKYLHPTSVEPKVRSESPGQPRPGINLAASCQFKEFVPNRKCLSNVSERGGDSSRSAERKAPADGDVGVKSDSFEGNKENIAENKRVEGRGKEMDGGGDVKKEPVESAFEFIKTWEELKKTDESYSKRAEIIRMIKPADLGKVIGIKLDPDMLSCLLKCLETHFVETDPKAVVEFLKQLPGVPRFRLVSMFLAENDKKILKKLIETAESRGFKLEDDVKKALSTS